MLRLASRLDSDLSGARLIDLSLGHADRLSTAWQIVTKNRPHLPRSRSWLRGFVLLTAIIHT